MKLLAHASAVAALISGLAGLASHASAAPVTFFGEDLNSTFASRLTNYPNSNVASADFQSHLKGTATETFENITVGTADPSIVFPGAGTAKLGGGGYVNNGLTSSNQYAAFGDNYLYTDNASLTVSFNSPIAAFGFYAIDTGESNDPIILTLTATDGTTSMLSVPQTSFSPSGSALFFGFYDTGTQYTNISFANTSGGGDVFAFDNFTVGSVSQVVVNPVPLPPALPMFGAAILGLAVISYGVKRKAAKAA